MVIHCTKKLAAKLPNVSAAALTEAHPIASWHAHLYHVDRRQCVLFCHDTTRFVLFLPGLRKSQLAELGSKWFKQLFSATLASFGCSDARIARAELALGPVRFDAATDRSVQSSINIVRQDLEYRVADVPNVLQLDPIAISHELSHRPTWIRGQASWPDRQMLEIVAAL